MRTSCPPDLGPNLRVGVVGVAIARTTRTPAEGSAASDDGDALRIRHTPVPDTCREVISRSTQARAACRGDSTSGDLCSAVRSSSVGGLDLEALIVASSRWRSSSAGPRVRPVYVGVAQQTTFV